MKPTRFFTVVVIAGSMSAAFAQQSGGEHGSATSSKTRAEVVAELERARAEGKLNLPDHAYPGFAAAGPGKTREEVRAELRQAHADGSLNYNDPNYPFTQLAGEGKSRQQVREELAQYRNGQPRHEGDVYSGG